MGTYLNPGNSGFADICKARYIDKTGILPIKKARTQSALSDFEEYTMLRPGPFAKYVGFTEAEVQESDQLIMDTIHGEEEKVAAQIRKVHMETTNPLNANREDSLRAVIQVAYFAYKDYYIKLQELPTGRGYADIVYLPKPGKGVPALVVELKWNRDAAGAIRQIKQKDYPAALAGYGGELLLVGISYEKGRDAYECTIERWEGAE